MTAKNKVIVVSGGGSRLGSAPAVNVARARVRVADAARSQAKLDAAEQRMRTVAPLVAAGLHSALVPLMSDLMTRSSIEIASSWTPLAGENEPKQAPIDLGSRAGGPQRLCQLFFVRGNVRDVIGRFHAYTDRIAGEGRAAAHLVAPFFRTKVGTDAYTDQLW
ncbi:MAG: hypothetical protein U0587_06910 [Candidatus Binatia bacterium]